jgi:class 3 adenylate cyclase/Flp pilus assembly protein TadD
VQALRSYVRESDPIALGWEVGAGGPEIAQLVPELGERLGIEAAAAPAAEGEEGRFRLFDAVTNFLSAAASDRPLMIVLDDLHWADEPSLQLLKFAAGGLGDSGLVIVGTYRDVELGRHHPLARVAADLGELEGSRHFTLRGLDAAAVARYIERASGTTPPPGLAEEVHARTEGNPFFVSEVVRLLVSEGQLSEGARPVSAARIAIPQGVREVVGRRLDRLSEDANTALQVGATIGREFDGEVVWRVSGMAPEKLWELADEAMAARLVERVGDNRYSFAHALVRETLHEELSPVQHARLHAKIATVLEEDGVETDDVGELAHHYLAAGAAGEPERALDYASLAAGQAMERLAYEDAADLLGRAAELLESEPDPEPRRCLQLKASLGDAQLASSDFLSGRKTLREVVNLARELDDRPALVNGVLQLARTSEVGNADEEVVALCEEALVAAGDGDTGARAGLLSTLSTELLWIDADRGREMASEGLEVARRSGDQPALALSLHRALITELHPGGTSDGRMRLIDELVDVAERTGDDESMLRAHAFRLRELLELGDVARADREIDSYGRIAEKLRMPQHLWHLPLFRAMRAMMAGDLERAEALSNEALAGGMRAGEPLAQQFFGIQSAQLRRLQGRSDELLPVFRDLTDRYPALPAWRTALALTLTQAGRVEEARVEFERLATDDFSAIPRDAQFYNALAILAEVCVAVGDRERSRLLYDWLCDMEGKLIVVGRAAVVQGPNDRVLGLLAAACGDREAAERHFLGACSLAERTGDRPMLAWCKTDHASMLLGVIGAASGHGTEPRAEDRERALELLSAAIETGREIGAAGLVDRGLGLSLEAQGLSGIDISTSIDEVIEAVESEKPDLRAHAAPDGTVTLLFSDIEDSTVITERLGDEAWLELLRSHNDLFRRRISGHGGYEVKSQGDGFMLAFPDPRAALECAVAVQRDFAARAAEPGAEPLRVRMGLHAGEVIAEEGDFFGKNVILAARIAAKAKGGEVLASAALKDVVGESDIAFCEAREMELKGLAGTHIVYRCEWEELAAQT